MYWNKIKIQTNQITHKMKPLIQDYFFNTNQNKNRSPAPEKNKNQILHWSQQSIPNSDKTHLQNSGKQ